MAFLEPTPATYLGRIRIYLPAVVFGLGASNVDFVAALLDVLHRSNFQDVVDDGQKLHTVSQQFLTDALACGKIERQNIARQFPKTGACRVRRIHSRQCACWGVAHMYCRWISPRLDTRK